MLIDISQLDRRGTRLGVQVEIEPFAWDGGQTVTCGPARLDGILKPTRRGIELTARVDTTATLTCTRCLEPFAFGVASEFTLFVVPVESDEDGYDALDRDDPDAIDLYPLVGDKLNLADVAREQVDLRLPVAAVCRAECKGLCSGCGANLNAGACGCEPDADERWSELREIRSILAKTKGPGPAKGH